MKPFTHKTRIGNIFDVLASPVEDDGQGFTVRRGSNRVQDTILSVLSGDLSLEQIPKLAASLRELLTSSVQVILLDLSHVNTFCPNAASVLVNFVSFVEGGGKRLVLFRPSESVQSTLSSLHLKHLFEIQQSEDELLLTLPD